MSDMKATLAEIVRARDLVAVSPDDYPRQTMAGFAMAARQAKDALPGLERQYVLALQGRSVTVAPVGPAKYTRAFRALAEEEGLELVVDVDDLYVEIANRVKLSMGVHHEWTATQHGLTVQYALSRAVDLGFTETVYDGNKPFGSRICYSMESCVNAVRDTIRERLGDDLPRVFLRAALTGVAVQKRLLPERDQPIGVLILGARTQEEGLELLKAWPSTSSVQILNEEPTVDSVVATFRQTRVSETDEIPTKKVGKAKRDK